MLGGWGWREIEQVSVDLSLLGQRQVLPSRVASLKSKKNVYGLYLHKEKREGRRREGGRKDKQVIQKELMKVTTCELDNGSSSGASLPKANIFPSF
jgi:hypothetical protein